MACKKFNELLKIIMKWKHLGIVKVNNKAKAIEIGNIPNWLRYYYNVDKSSPKAYLHTYFGKLEEPKMNEIESLIKKKFPKQYKDFLRCSNGIILFKELSVYGFRHSYERVGDEAVQPFDVIAANYNLTKKIPKEWLAVGGYNGDASIVYFDTSKDSNKVFRCKKHETEILQEWPDFWNWLISEVKRISKMYNKEGYKINLKEPSVE